MWSFTFNVTWFYQTNHYYGNYGSPKNPNIPEALILHFIDNIDSKMTVLEETLDTVEPGEFTTPIMVLDRERYYKSMGVIEIRIPVLGCGHSILFTFLAISRAPFCPFELISEHGARLLFLQLLACFWGVLGMI